MKLYPEHSCLLTSAEDIRNYILGGNGVVTLKSPTGVHHTYAFRRPRNTEEFPDDILFVYAVHEGKTLFYVGMIEDGKFRLTRASRFLHDTPIVKGARYIMRMSQDSTFGPPMELYHEGMCSRCGRPLTNPKSILTGFGPKCRRMRK